MFTPSQLPAQTEPSLAQAGREPCGASLTGEHTPESPTASQAWHCPEHRESQQTPSTQKPLAQLTELVQLWPSASLGRQLPFEQYEVETQSRLLPQFVPQAVAAQTYSPHDAVATAGQETLAPVQFAASVPTPAAHEAPRQLKDDALRISVGQVTTAPVQFSAGSQLPPEARHSTPATARAFAGQNKLTPSHASATSQSPAAARQIGPAATGEQVPSVPLRLHAWQSLAPAPHAELQHTPSTQLPLAHATGSAHTSPLALGTVKVAVTFIERVIVSVHWSRVPAPEQSPPQPENASPAPAIAFSATVSPSAKASSTVTQFALH